MATNIVNAVFGGSKETITRKIRQWDYGMLLVFSGLELPQAYEVHFSNTEFSGNAKTQIGDENGVIIPDEYLTTGEPVYAWLYLHTGADDGETVYSVKIPVVKRAMPTHEEPTPVQQSEIEQALAALNSAVEQTAADVIAANESAEAASDAADVAVEARDQAIDAKEAAKDAQEGAETAEDKAKEAQQSAEDARDSAQEAADSILNLTADGTVDNTVGIPSVDVNVTEAEGHKNMSFAFHNVKGEQGEKGDKGDKGDIPYDEIYGIAVTKEINNAEIAQFADGADNVPTKELIVRIEPVQDLNGQANPYPPGGGTNIWGGIKLANDINNAVRATLDTTAKTIKFSTNAQPSGSDDSCVFTPDITFEENTVYTLITDGTASGLLNMMFKYTDGTNDRSLGRNPVIGAFSSASGKTVENVVYRSYSGNTVLNYDKCGLFKGSVSASAFAPYSNICPVSGWTGMNVDHSGKNLFDESEYKNLVSNYEYISNSYHCRAIQLKPYTTYTVSQNSGVADSGTILLINNISGVNGNGYFDCRKVSDKKTYTTDSTGCLYIGVLYSSDSNYNARLALCKVQIELGSTETTYEGFNGNTYPISWQSEAGTVYGGSLDVTTGLLSVDSILLQYPDITWEQINANNGFKAWRSYVSSTFATKSGAFALSNMVAEFGSFSSASMTKNIIQLPAFLVNKWVMYMALQEDVDPNDVQVWYQIANAQTYQLDPVQIRTLLKENALWADTGNVIKLIYPCDANEYIEESVDAWGDSLTAVGTVDANIGTPSIEVGMSDVDDHKQLSFAFHNLKGQKGDTGNPGSNPISFTATLLASSWSSSALTISDQRLIASGYTYMVSASSSSTRDYQDADIYADDVTTDGQMTFHCMETPTSDLTVNIIRLELGE